MEMSLQENDGPETETGPATPLPPFSPPTKKPKSPAHALFGEEDGIHTNEPRDVRQEQQQKQQQRMTAKSKERQGAADGDNGTQQKLTCTRKIIHRTEPVTRDQS